MAEQSSFRRVAFAATPSVLCAALVAAVYGFVASDEQVEQRGKRLNRSAWEHSYLERGLPVPVSGPRTGYWGSRLGPRTKQPELGWHLPELQIEGLVDVDARGFQRYSGTRAAERRVLILGGSVAFASYPSSIETTYFHLLGLGLEAANMPTRIDVLADGAWKAVQEVRALELYISEYRPDLVVLLDGLNDLTVGATAHDLFGEDVEEDEKKKRRKKKRTRHARDYPRRVTEYLRNVRAAAELAQAHDCALLVVLQPSLAEREPPSSEEQQLVRGTVRLYGPLKVLRRSYQAMREGLHKLEAEGLLTFLDASRAFNDEPYTTFADAWHFGDAGHRILADRMVDVVRELLEHRIDAHRKAAEPDAA